MINKLLVEDVFSSIQGEGLGIGIPSIFVRFGGCNCSCAWCDTGYGSNSIPKSIEDFKKYTPQELYYQVFNTTSFIKRVVITGGEPYVQDYKMLTEFIKLLYDKAYHITVETNGTFLPPPEAPIDIYSISPKLFSATGCETITEKQYEVIEYHIDKHPLSFYLKFVIDTKSSKDINHLIRTLDNIIVRRGKIAFPIVLQPAFKKDKRDGGYNELYTLARDYGLFMAYKTIRVLPQIHQIARLK